MIGKGFLLLMMGLVISGCSLPRPGPSISEVTSLENGLPIVSITEWTEGFDDTLAAGGPVLPEWYFAAPRYSVDGLRPGDQVRVLIAESSSNGEFLQSLSAPLIVEGVTIEEDGTIRLPYAGRVAVAGRTPSEAASVIAGRIDNILYRPQVQVTRSASASRAVTFVGEEGGESVELGSDLDSLLDVVLSADAPIRNDADYLVELRRAGQRAVVPLELLLENPEYDAPLRPGDVVRLTRSVSQFTILGSIGEEKLVPLPRQGLSLVQALATAGGLDGNIADPSGIFLFRKVAEGQPIIYRLDMSDPAAIFAGNEFPVRNNDVIYVSYAPFTQTQKILRAISGTIGVGSSAAQITR